MPSHPPADRYDVPLPRGRLVTLAALERMRPCPGGDWAFFQAFGEGVWLTVDHAEIAAPWLDWIARSLPKREVRRIRAAEAAWWDERAAARGCTRRQLPAGDVAELRLRLAREILQAVIDEGDDDDQH